jgi:GNAT superfamily N-acetyltransferase
MVIRELATGDSIEHLTELLHRAFAPLGRRGMNYSAVDQSPSETARRISTGLCAVATLDGIIVGTVMAESGPDPASESAWYRRLDVASAHQLGVEPSHQRRGIGSALMRWAESWAVRSGYAEIAVDTAEPATELISFYTRLGYRQIEYAQWHGKRYRSVILSKPLKSAT